jgi:predicted transcriptional regulator
MMSRCLRWNMRSTLTLDEDVAAKLKSLARRTGRSFKQVVNETLRQGLIEPRKPTRSPFAVKVRDLGPLSAGVSLDNIGELLEHIEGPAHR